MLMVSYEKCQARIEAKVRARRARRARPLRARPLRLSSPQSRTTLRPPPAACVQGHGTCEGQYMDYVLCVDTCVSRELFHHLK